MKFIDKEHALKNLVYISLPENLEQNIGEFRINSSILLPVELHEGETASAIAQISWEQIAAALCKVIAWDPEHQNIEYFKDFLLAIRPEIETELSLGAVKKADQKEFSLAEEIFMVLKNLFPQNCGHQLNLALSYEQHAAHYQKGQQEETASHYNDLAFREYLDILKKEPDSTEACFNAGHFFFSQANYTRALECFKKYLKHGKDAKRTRLLKEIVEKLESSNSRDDLFKQAYDLIVLNREEEGLEKIDSFLIDNPDIWNGWFLKGWAHRRTGDYEKGRQAFEKALSLGDPNPDLFNELAICAMEMGDFAQSRLYLEKALKMEPENVKIISNLGILALKEGDLELAAGFFRSILLIDENDVIAGKYLSYIEELGS